MQKYRKKPVVVEAEKFTGQQIEGVKVYVAGRYHGEQPEGTPLFAEIETLEGTMHAEIGDWIIRGIKGELYPCKADIFEATYEPVGSTD